MVSIKQSKFVKSLKLKKYRTKENCFIVEGGKNVLEAISSNCSIRYLLATSEFLQNNDLSGEIIEKKILEVTAKELEDLGTFKVNNECLAVVEMFTPQMEVSFSDHVVALDGVSDPGNLGTIIRTMDWFGFKTLVCSRDTADFYNPKVINSTMGSFTRIQVVYTALDEFLKKAPLPSFGADLHGLPLQQWNPESPVILVMGSESHGLSESVSNQLTQHVTIPKIGGAESLNVAIATSILCSHLRL